MSSVRTGEEVFQLQDPVTPDSPADATHTNSSTKRASKQVAVVSLLRLMLCSPKFIDWLLLLIGSAMAMIHGAALPVAMLVFGDLTNAFVNQYASTQLANYVFYFEPEDFLDRDEFFIVDPLILASGVIDFRNITGGVVNCSEDYVLIAPSINFDEALQLGVTRLAKCLEDDEFIDEVDGYVQLFAIIAMVVFLTSFVQIVFFQFSAERQIFGLKKRFYRAVLRQNIGWFDANPTGELSTKLSEDINRIHDGIGDTLAILIQWVTTFFAGFIVGFIAEWRLTLLLLTVVPFIAVSGAVFSVVTTKFSSKEQREYASAGGVAEEVLSAVRTVIAFGGEYKEVERYNGHLKQAKKTGRRKGAAAGILLGSSYFFVFISYAAAFWLGGYLISEEIIQAGEVLTVFFAVLVGAYSIGQAAPKMEKLLSAGASAAAIYEVIDRHPPIDSSSDAGTVPDDATFHSDVEFRKVGFSYPTRPDIQVLSEFNLKVGLGQTVALVGPSGCGKTTAVQLLLRLYDIHGGEILVGGRDVRTLNITWLRRHIGLVSQKPVLFDTTIADNIGYGQEDATKEQIVEAAKTANAHQFIVALPDGYDTVVGDSNTQLSAGQKQRIAIARALVRDPKILLLDEATSALDSQSEAVVQAALDRARLGRTTIVIAHRLSTVQNADLIVAMDKGQVVEVGTHSQLMTSQGLYYDLVTAQAHHTELSEGPGEADSHAEEDTKEDSLPEEDKPWQNGALEKSLAYEEVLHPEDKEVKTEGGKKVSWFRVMKLNANEWWIIVLGTLGAAVQGAVFPVFAIFFAEVLRDYTLPAERVLDEIHLWAGLSLLVGGISAIATFFKMLCFSVSGENLTCRLRSLAFRAMLRQEVAWFDQESNSTKILSTRLATDASRVQGATGTQLGTMMEAFAGILTAIIIAFYAHWLLTLVVLGFLPFMVMAGLLQLITFSTYAASDKGNENATKHAVETVENIRTVAAFSAEETSIRLYSGQISKPYSWRVWLLITLYGVGYSFSHGIILLAYAVAFRFGAYLQTRSVDDSMYARIDEVYLVFIALVFGGLGVGQAGSIAPNYTKAKASAARIISLLDREPVIDNFSETGSTPEKSSGELVLQDVHFAYPTRPTVQVLQGLSVAVRPGQTLAVVGASGCGKSTIMSLIERFYDPQYGRILLDTSDLRDLNTRWLRSQIGLVSQEPALFDRSIADNIRYGDNSRDVSDDEVTEAAKAANIHNFILSLPLGYETRVGERGTQLSGGQKQRIAIARALVRNPTILLLDDATSALDTESEKVVQEAFDRARSGRTSVMIAHRLSAVYSANCIAVVQDGQVVEMGTHTQLVARKGPYYRLSLRQMMNGLN